MTAREGGLRSGPPDAAPVGSRRWVFKSLPSHGEISEAPNLGRTGIAVQFFDSQTGQVVAEFTDDRFGEKYVIGTNQGTVAGVTDYVRAYSTWAYAQAAFDAWAAQFRKRLDQIHGR